MHARRASVQPTSPRGVAVPVHRPIVAYPGYDVMSQQGHWDDATRALILQRIRVVPPIHFFNDAEVQLLMKVVDRIMPQDDRPPDQRVPIVPWIDHRCFYDIIDGFRYDDMPPEPEAWRMGLRGIDQVARSLHQQAFVDLDEAAQDKVLGVIAEGKPPGSVWEHMPAHRFWSAILMRIITSIYYAHPTAWNEIGFGGPAYPRGYASLNHGLPEPWEVREVRLDATSD